MKQLAKYATMVDQLRQSEEALVLQRMAIIELENWLLVEERRGIGRRREESAKELTVAHSGWLGDGQDLPYMFRPFPQPVVASSPPEIAVKGGGRGVTA
jgi:hypothetical protein